VNRGVVRTGLARVASGTGPDGTATGAGAAVAVAGVVTGAAVDRRDVEATGAGVVEVWCDRGAAEACGTVISTTPAASAAVPSPIVTLLNI
jgi:hypothetical protein